MRRSLPPERRLLVLGLAYRALADAFAYPARGSAAADVASLAEDLAETVHMLTDEGDLAAKAGAVSRAAQVTISSALGLEEEYNYLFMRRTPVSPYESRYLSPLAANPYNMVDVAAFYKAFGFEVAPAAGELADHLGAELEFLGFLCLRGAYALENRWEEQAVTCSEARAAFLRDHLGRWLPAFAAGLRAKARLPWYPALADLAVALLAYDEADLGVVPEVVASPGIDGPRPEPAPVEGECPA